METKLTTTDGRNRSQQSRLIDVNTVAALCGCSARHAWRLSDSGRMPSPIALGALRRWDRAVIEAWITDGCPAVRKAVR